MQGLTRSKQSPKLLAANRSPVTPLNPEGIARLLAGSMRKPSVPGRPLLSLLSWATESLLETFRVKPGPEATVTEDDVKLLVPAAVLNAVLLRAKRSQQIRRWLNKPGGE